MARTTPKKPSKGSRSARASGTKPPPKPKPKPAPRKVAKPAARVAADIAFADPSLFAPVTEGERADALRLLLDDARLRALAKVGRYRVIAVEPLVVKPPDALVGHRLARVVVYDYATRRAIDAAVDLDDSLVAVVKLTETQPMLSADEETQAIAVALAAERVTSAAAPGDAPLGVLQTWARSGGDLDHLGRTAAVLFGKPGAPPTMVAVVDLSDNQVTDVVPAERW